jgi:hypothetical protein
MKREPLFLRFVNSTADAADIARSLVEGSKDEATVEVASKVLQNEEFGDLKQFRADFANMLEDLIDNGPIPPVRQYLTDYMEPSLSEYANDSAVHNTGMTDRWVSIKDPEAPWMEAIVCYNLCMYLKGFGGKDLKRCPVCFNFFNHKGPHAVYCSQVCKQSPAAAARRGG